MTGLLDPTDPTSCDFGMELHEESWGPATARVAVSYPWRSFTRRVIVPIADEGACKGNTDGCSTAPGTPDRDAVDEAVILADQNLVFVFPVTGVFEPFIQLQAPCVRTLASTLALGAEGQHFDVQLDGGYTDPVNVAIDDKLAAALVQLTKACVNPCPADIVGPIFGPPDCEVSVNDFLELFARWTSPNACCPDCVKCEADLDDDGIVGVTDMLILLAEWGPCQGCLYPVRASAGGKGDQDDLLAALNALGFEDLAHFHEWVLSADEADTLISLHALALLLLGGSD